MINLVANCVIKASLEELIYTFKPAYKQVNGERVRKRGTESIDMGLYKTISYLCFLFGLSDDLSASQRDLLHI